MRVYLVRHGIAAEHGYEYDGERPLTDEGRLELRRTLAAWVDRGEAPPARVLVSPLVRAVQTAECLLAAFGRHGPCEVTRALVPGGSHHPALHLLDEVAEESVALVGHDPLISTLGAQLLGVPHLPLAFEKGAVLAVELPSEQHAGLLAFYLRPGRGEVAPRFLTELG